MCRRWSRARPRSPPIRPSLPFVFISGYTDPVNVAAELGPLRLIRKPFRSAELIGQIEAALATVPEVAGD